LDASTQNGAGRDKALTQSEAPIEAADEIMSRK
jgi:hypothetical protein